MSDPQPARPSTSQIIAAATPTEQVLQVERHDFVDLVPTNRPRSQSLRGFDPC